MFLYIKLVHHYFIIILTYNYILEKNFCLLRITITYMYFVIIIRALFHTRSISLLLQLVINQQLITAKSCIHFAVPLQNVCSGTAHRYAVRLQQLCSDTATHLQSHCKIHAARMQTRCSHQIPISILRHTRSKELESFHLP